MDSSRPSALPDWSAVPNNSEEDRRFLNLRLAYFGGLGFILSACMVVVRLCVGRLVGFGVGRQLGRPEMVTHLLAMLVFGAEWLLCRRGRRSSWQLNLLDVGTVLGALCMYGYSLAVTPAAVLPASSAGVASRDPGFEPALFMMLITLLVVITRAVIVPGTGRRTLWVSIASSCPALAVASIAVHAPWEEAGVPWSLVGGVMYVAAWSGLAVAAATLASRVIYGLSQRVRNAMELGQYTLEEKIGEGGMGIVYRARHALLRRPTAVKLLPRERAGERSIRRFEQEVQLTSALTHPNTISIYDYGRTPDGVFYYAMEYLEGVSLQDLITHDGPQSAGRVIHVLKQLCGALQEAHAVGLVHRDVKPANIVLCVRGGIADFVKVLDFGLVKEMNESSQAMSIGDAVVGTPMYLAPEAITDPNRIDARTDLYALGGVAYELLTGKPVFEGASVLEVCAKHLHEAPVPPSKKGGRPIPSALETLVLSCLAKNPDDRPASAAQILNGLDASPGLEPWNPVEAARWWDERAPRILASLKADRCADPAASGRRTVHVDLTRRHGSLG
jgi:eukaryotic-like serine/threonine-protein kinase